MCFNDWNLERCRSSDGFEPTESVNDARANFSAFRARNARVCFLGDLEHFD
jgi:hypothetical protein